MQDLKDIIRRWMVDAPALRAPESCQTPQLADGLIWPQTLLGLGKNIQPTRPILEGFVGRRSVPQMILDEHGRSRAVYGQVRLWALAATAKHPFQTHSRDDKAVGYWPDVRREPIRFAEAEDVSVFLFMGAAAMAESGESVGAAQWLEAMVNLQRQSGNFIASVPADNAELTWYHELVILHGLMLCAAFVKSTILDQAIRRAALFHLNETQPDHATHHPWALAAFISHPECRPVAESMLHAMQSQFANGPDVLSRILLADALWLLDGR